MMRSIHRTLAVALTLAVGPAFLPRPLEDLLHNNKASAQQRVEYCSALEKWIKLTKQEHEERSKYMELDRDRFDWFNKGTTAAKRLADHQGALKKVDAQLKNLYNSRDRFCR